MAQLKSGKIYIVDNVGIKNYTNEPSYHTVPKYFTWLSNKIATGLGIEMQPIIKDSQNCCLPLPYINDPTENRLCLCLRGITLDTGLVFKIGYFNGNDYHIGNDIELPYLMYSNQSMSIKYKNSSTYTYYPYNSGALFPSETGSFVIDTRFLESNGFYTMAFLPNTTNEIDEVAVSPRVFICDMVDVLTEKHYDGLFTLPSYTYDGGYVPSSSGYQELGAPSIGAIGVDKDGKYSLQGYFPQIFVSDYSSAGTRTQETLISASMIRVQFGRLRAAHDIYLTRGNSTENLMDCCDVKNIKDNHIDWNENVLKINNKKYSLSCNCERVLFDDAKPQWAVVIKDKIKDEKEELSALEFCSDGNFTLSVENPNWNGTIEYSENKGKTWVIWHGEELSGKANKSIYLRGSDNTRITGQDQEEMKIHWLYTGKSIKGNIESLLDYKKVQENKHPTMDPYCYTWMFYNCTSLVEVPDLLSPNLSIGCYMDMFHGCTSLEVPPSELPATIVHENSYRSLFRECASLKITPKMPATLVERNGYCTMFQGCTSLEVPPSLPATTLADWCYYGMFMDCTSLEVPPSLPATILAQRCYQSMFWKCTSLKKLPNLPALRPSLLSYDHMFYNCNKIKISKSKSDQYKYSYRIPTSGYGSGSQFGSSMFKETGGPFQGDPVLNMTYYTTEEPV